MLGKDRTDILRRLAAAAAIALALSACAGCRGKSNTSPPPSAATASQSVAAPVQLNDAQRRLADAFVAAVNSNDADALSKLVVPEALACYNTEDTKAYLGHWARTHMRVAIPPGYKLSFAPYEAGFQPSRLFTAPVPPAQRMTIEFELKGQPTLLSNLVSEEKGSFYLFLPCITDAGIKGFKMEQTRREDALKKAQEVYSKLKEPQRSRLVKLAKQGRTPDALNQCKNELGIDFRTSAYLLDLLAGRKPDEER